jgi:hypothetical protein
MSELEWQQVDWTEIPVGEIAPASTEKAAYVKGLSVSVEADNDILEHPDISIDD